MDGDRGGEGARRAAVEGRNQLWPAGQDHGADDDGDDDRADRAEPDLGAVAALHGVPASSAAREPPPRRLKAASETSP